MHKSLKTSLPFTSTTVEATDHVQPNGANLFDSVECRAMLIARFPHRRFLATCLPLSLLWVFVACISLCERETSHRATPRVTSIDVGMIKEVPDCDGCPLNFFPKATSPEQAKLIANLEAALSASSPAIPSSLYSNPDILNYWPHGQLCTASPPLEPLSALRI